MKNIERGEVSKENRAEEYFEKQYSRLDPETRRIFESHELYPLFYPKTVAIVGVSGDPGYGASTFMLALEGFNYSQFGTMYPINPKYAGKDLHGYRCYESLESLPETPDYVLSGLPATKTPDIVRDAVSVGAKFFIIFSSGFNEIEADAGRGLYEEIFSIINSTENKDSEGRKRLRLVGPNCVGVYNPSGGMAQFIDRPQDMYGDISMISQSGGQGRYLASYFSQRNHPARMCISVGNVLDINEMDIIDFYRVDPFSRAVLCYMEGLPQDKGSRMLEIIKDTVKTKPVVIWKAGKTKASHTAVSSHTGTMAGNADIFEAAMRQAGAIVTNSLESIFDVTSSLLLPSFTPLKRNYTVKGGKEFTAPVGDNSGMKIGIALCGGGASVEAADAFSARNIQAAAFDQETKKAMAEALPGVNTFIVNPVDIGDTGYNPDLYRKILELLAADKNVDLIITSREIERFAMFGRWFSDADLGATHADIIKSVNERYQKPIFVIVPEVEIDTDSHMKRLKFINQLREANIPSFPTAERAAVAVSLIKKYLKSAN